MNKCSVTLVAIVLALFSVPKLYSQETVEIDLRLDSIKYNLGTITPSRHFGSANYTFHLYNNSAIDLKLVVEALSGETLLATSDTTDIKSKRYNDFECSLDFGKLEVGVYDFEFRARAVSSDGEVSYQDTNEENSSVFLKGIKVSQDEFAKDILDENANFDDFMPVGPQESFVFGNIYTLLEDDTLTAIKLGFGNSGYVNAYTVDLEIWSVKENPDKNPELVDYLLDELICQESFKRDAIVGFKTIEVKNRILEKGSYLIGLRQVDGNPAILTDDDTLNGCIYAYNTEMQSKLGVKNPLYGSAAIRAIFGEVKFVCDVDLEVYDIKRPGDKGSFTENQTIVVNLRNHGTQLAQDALVKCKVNGKELEAQKVDVPRYGSVDLEFEANMIEVGMYKIEVEVVHEQDADEYNNTLDKQAECLAVDLYKLDFEACDDFLINDFTPRWESRTRQKGRVEASFASVRYPHMREPFGFIVYNPYRTVPPQMGADDEEFAYPCSTCGEKYGASLYHNTLDPDANYPRNDDWLISPKLKLGKVKDGQFPRLSFMVKAWVSLSKEEYRVLVSTTDNDYDSFEAITDTLSPTNQWQKVNIDLSDFAGQEVYVAIQCVSNNSYIFMIDNIEVDPGSLSNEGTNGLEKYFVLGSNPVKDELSIYTSKQIEINSVEIYNALGKKMHSSAKNLRLSSFRHNVSKYPSGIYFARLRTSMGDACIKFVK